MKKKWIKPLIISCFMLLVCFGLCACSKEDDDTKYTLNIYVDNEIYQTVELEESEIENYTLPTLDIQKDNLYYFSGWTGDIEDNNSLKINDYSKTLTLRGNYKPIFYVSQNGELSVDVNDITKSFEELVIPSNINGIEVKSIGNSEFRNFNNLSSIVLPTTLQSIGDYAFDRCWGLREVINLSNINIKIGSAENGGVAFHAYHIGNSINDRLQYQNIDGTLYVEDNDHLIAIGVEDRNTKEIIINEETDSISDFAFAHCQNVEKIYFNATACYGLPTTTHSTCGIGYNSKNVTVYISANVKGIPDRLFLNSWSDEFYGNYYGATHIKNVVFAEGSQCTNIGDYSFQDCIYLEAIEIPYKVTYLGAYALFGCYNITINYNAVNCKNVRVYSIPVNGGSASGTNSIIFNIGRGVQQIPDNLCGGGGIVTSSNITEINFQEGSICERIGKNAFTCSKITEIILPNSITTIAENALGKNCTKIYFLGTNEQWSNIEKYNDDYNNITTYYYIANENEVPNSGGNYWHYDADGKTPIIWEIS